MAEAGDGHFAAMFPDAESVFVSTPFVFVCCCHSHPHFVPLEQMDAGSRPHDG
jgi:hypothetical protein